MRFKKELIHGHLVKRYKRFLADVALDEAVRRGVEIIVVQAKVLPDRIVFRRILPVAL